MPPSGHVENPFRKRLGWLSLQSSQRTPGTPDKFGGVSTSHLPGRPRRTRPAGFITGLAVVAIMLLFDAPEGLSPAAWRVAAVAVLMAVWWVTEALPIAATALLPLVLFPPLGIATLNAAASPYANPVIYLFLGGFLLAAALQRVRLHQRLALDIIALVGTRPDRLVLGFIVATAAISMWVSNTATVVMILPLAMPVLELVRTASAGTAMTEEAAHDFEVALLLGIAYAASIGGLGTLIGTPPNALLAGFMADSFGTPIGFGRWMLVGVPIVIVGLPLTWLLLTRVVYHVSHDALPGAATMVSAQRSDMGGIRTEEWVVGGVVGAAAVCWIFQPLLARVVPGLTEPAIGIAAALLLFIVPAEDGEPVLQGASLERVPWGVLVLFGGGLSLAAAIQESGLAAWLGASLEALRTYPLVMVMLIVATVVVFLSELTSNTATAAAFIPLAAALATGIGAEPVMLVVTTAVAASLGFMMPVGTPPNALVFGTGRVRIAEMARAGFLLNLVMIAVVVAICYWGAGRLVR